MWKRVGHWLAVLAFNAAAIGLTLVAFESFLRHRSPRRGLPPNGTIGGVLYTWGHAVRKNRFGARDREPVLPKPGGVFRVMVLGDSLTWGAGLAEHDRYTAVAERALRARFPERGVELLNFGFAGGPTVAERDFLRAHAPAIEPDLVVVGFCLNDPQPKSERWSPERERFEAEWGPSLARWRDRIAALGLPETAELAHEASFIAAELLRVFPRWDRALQRAYEPASQEWRAFEQALADIRAISDSRGLPPPVFAVLNQGTAASRPTPYARPQRDPDLQTFLRWYHQAEDAARRAGLLVYNHEAELAAELAHESLAVNPADNHPSARVNAVYGRKLAEQIARLLAAKPD
jgi:lysophospholipase L1-like esterase